MVNTIAGCRTRDSNPDEVDSGGGDNRKRPRVPPPDDALAKRHLATKYEVTRAGLEPATYGLKGLPAPRALSTNRRYARNRKQLAAAMKVGLRVVRVWCRVCGGTAGGQAHTR